MNLDEELKICMDHKKQGFCYWGVCEHCGVPQMLKKLKDGKIEHDEAKHNRFRKIAAGSE